jgi:hypothetical protein
MKVSKGFGFAGKTGEEATWCPNERYFLENLNSSAFTCEELKSKCRPFLGRLELSLLPYLEQILNRFGCLRLATDSYLQDSVIKKNLQRGEPLNLPEPEEKFQNSNRAFEINDISGLNKGTRSSHQFNDKARAIQILKKGRFYFLGEINPSSFRCRSYPTVIHPARR